ncbi:MAG TPA: hypothetical protein VMS17_15705 [Gemmataceae bacterium]|nr:hypothetical protein [Gemmataceae bacterium]
MARLSSAVVLAALLLLAPASAAADRDEAPRTDSHGDPLPAGALVRLGTVRWRACADFLAFLPDGKTLLTGEYNYGSGSLVRFWDTATGKENASFHVPGAMEPCALSPDGKMLAMQAIHDTNIIRLVSVPGGKEFRRIEAKGELGLQADVTPLGFSPDGKMLVGYDGASIRLFDVETGKDILHPAGFGVDRLPTALSPDSKRLACVVEDGALCVIEIPSGKPVFKQRLRKIPTVLLNPSFSPDGKNIAWFGEDEKTFGLWDAASGKPVRQFRGSVDRVETLQFSPDGKHIAARCYREAHEWSIGLWDAETGKELRQLVPPSRIVGPFAFSPDGKRLAACDDRDGVVHVWDVETGEEVSRVGEHQGSVCSVAFSPDGRTAFTGCMDRVIRVWDADKGVVERRFEVGEGGALFFHIVFSRDGTTAATGDSEGFTDIYNLVSGKERVRLNGEGGDLRRVALAPDGKTLAANGEFNGVQLWDAQSGKKTFRLGEETIQHFAFSSNGKALVVASVIPNLNHTRMLVWDVRTGKQLHEWSVPHLPLLDVQFSLDGKLVATTDLLEVSLWDPGTGKELLRCSARDTPDDGALCTIAFSPDGRTLAAGTTNGPIYLWEVSTAKLRIVLTGHQNGVTSLAFSPDGSRLISGSHDTTALIWDLTGLADEKASQTLTPERLASLWDDLADGDAGTAWHAGWQLTADPSASVAFLQKHLRPAAVDAERIARLLADLDSEDFEAREKASGELAALGEVAGPALRRALEDKPSAEARQRLEELVRRLGGLVTDAEQARVLRGVEVLEHMGTADARRLLEELAEGAEGSRQTREAKAALERLAERLPH